MEWTHTTVQHGPRKRMGISGDDYTLLDLIYHTQTSPKYGKDGWCEHPYSELADVVGVGKGSIFQMVDRLTKKGLMEVNPTNPKRKRATERFSLQAYHGAVEDEMGGLVIPSVQKVNAERSESERKRSESERKRSESERKRSESERHNKEEIKKGIIKEEKVSAPAKSLDWKEVAELMLQHSQNAGQLDWEFMKAATGYKGDGKAVFSGWAAKAGPWELLNWKDNFRRLQTWMRNEARADLKSPQPDQQPKRRPIAQLRPERERITPEQVEVLREKYNVR